MIPIFSPAPQYDLLKNDIDAILIEVAASGQFILGPWVKQFEDDFAATMHCSEGVGVNSGTDALLLALKALDIGQGDEVITTCFSYIATSEVIVRVGATPIFVDINPESFNLSSEAVEAAITPRTKAIIPVHLFGQAVDMTALMAVAKKHGLFVIEDCAQAAGATWHGQPVGSYGDAGCFSFFPTKNLGALGDAGMITTQNKALADRMRSLRMHGATPENKYDHQESGINSRLDSLQAAVLGVKLPYLEEWNTQRRQIAQYYSEKIEQDTILKEAILAPQPPHFMSMHVFHQYTIRVKQERDALHEALSKLGVMAMIYYPIPLHLQKTHAALGYAVGQFPNAERVAEQVLSLPIYPGLSRAQQDSVIEALKQALVSNQVLA
jgi:dTDP-4-amino-4,6-dideoxygalactose transaminase